MESHRRHDGRDGETPSNTQKPIIHNFTFFQVIPFFLQTISKGASVPDGVFPRARRWNGICAPGPGHKGGYWFASRIPGPSGINGGGTHLLLGFFLSLFHLAMHIDKETSFSFFRLQIAHRYFGACPHLEASFGGFSEDSTEGQLRKLQVHGSRN